MAEWLERVDRTLVTTALEQSWPSEGPVLFLGEWCRRFSRRKRWVDLDAEIVPYHWDDRDRLDADYVYIANCYERLLADLSTSLNDLHDIDRSSRFWRILTGPWLGFFVSMAFDRWMMVEEAVSRTDLNGTILLDGLAHAMTPSDMRDFENLFVTDEWNHHLYGRVLEEFGGVQIEHRDYTPVIEESSPEAVAETGSWRYGLLSKYSRLAHRLSRRGDVVLEGPYLKPTDELSLHRRLGQVPILWSMVEQPWERFEPGDRPWAMNGESIDRFEAFVRSTAVAQIPCAYVEGYQRMQEMVDEVSWPSHPKVIFTSNSHIGNDMFKFWSADRLERGSKLMIGQHGGSYGTARRSFPEDHEVAISDRYLSWGWDDQNRDWIKPVGQLRGFSPLGVDHGCQPHALLVTTTLPQQSYSLVSAVVASQWLQYLEDQFNFVARLTPGLRETLVVRLAKEDYDWDQVGRWQDRWPDIRIDSGQMPIRNLLTQTRIYIATYNATTFLESLAMDIPTIIFWRPEHWELRGTAIEPFEELSQAGIFHKSAESAADHLSDVWSDVDAWWGDRKVRSAIDNFNYKFNRQPADLVGAVANEIWDLVRNHQPDRRSD